MNFLKDIKLRYATLINFINLDAKKKEMIRSWRNYKEIRRLMYSRHLISKAEHAGFIEKLKKEKIKFYWLVRINTGEFIGVISLERVDFVNGHCYLGIYTNPFLPVSGKGVILMKCLKDLVFGKARMHTLKLEVVADNQRAIRFYKRSGFKSEGKIKGFVSRGKEWEDVIVMGMFNKTKGR